MGILQVRMLKWVAMLSSRGSSQPRDQTQISYIAGKFFTYNDPVCWSPTITLYHFGTVLWWLKLFQKSSDLKLFPTSLLIGQLVSFFFFFKVVLLPSPGLVACHSKAKKEAKLVEKKVCFILDIGNLGKVGLEWTPVQRPTPPLHP